MSRFGAHHRTIPALRSALATGTRSTLSVKVMYKDTRLQRLANLSASSGSAC
ncbi:hypothetical protein PPTG_21632 [Phytophthora nicotianae INRA-310]|uniref:Uncharacterized protein n=1 Tax=Phytophthora nicotianae (strain INRA-310) TaxID=761204 RepID=W2QVT1_PHYN3|nr:hypothetical protein PPTG_21632 [Phytophthora nicotianae INRA-310]ETN17233.1 hypothetical protein PPTG_21632 [Phytophthora nicotianae INRA-310]